MTPRERVRATLASEPVDRTPTVSFLPSVPADVCLTGPPGTFRLAGVLNPVATAWRDGFDVVGHFNEDPEWMEKRLERAVLSTRQQLEEVGDADGIAYFLHGACENWMSPMGYGGWLLEMDRGLLQEARKPVFIFVVGRDAYLDVLSDLPCDVFAWDADVSGGGVAEMRQMTRAKIATNRPEADFRLETGGLDAVGVLEADAPIQVLT